MTYVWAALITLALGGNVQVINSQDIGVTFPTYSACSQEAKHVIDADNALEIPGLVATWQCIKVPARA